jgi:hypothetical protein
MKPFHSESRLGWRVPHPTVTLPPHTELREDTECLYLYGEGGELVCVMPGTIPREDLQDTCYRLGARRFDDEWLAERVYGDPSRWRKLYQ